MWSSKGTLFLRQAAAYIRLFSTGTAASSQVTGALAVAEGAGQTAVRLRLTEALETLLSLPPGSALVLEMGE